MKFFGYFAVLSLLILGSCDISDIDKPSSISGKVTDASGTGLSEVDLRVISKLEDYKTTTSSNGTYQIEAPISGPYELIFSKQNFESVSNYMIVYGDHHYKQDIVLSHSQTALYRESRK